MNFIDALLPQLPALEAEEIIAAVITGWSDATHGIAEESALAYPVFIQDLLHIADFDSVCNWNGLESFVTQCDKTGYQNTIRAFDNCGYALGAEILRAIGQAGEVLKLQAGKCCKLGQATEQLIARREKDLYFHQVNPNFWPALDAYVDEAKRRFTAD